MSGENSLVERGRAIQLSSGLVALVDEGDYDDLAKFKWWVSGSRQKGSIYAARQVASNGGRLTFLMHRQITNAPPGYEVDHINGNTLDNRRQNLRVVTRAINQVNKHRVRSYSKSGVVGVEWHKGRRKYRAAIWRDGKRIYKAQFDSLEEATAAIQAARAKLLSQWAAEALVAAGLS